MRKIVINCCYGGFGLSKEAKDRLNGKDEDSIARDDQLLVDVVTSLGNAANGKHAKLVVVQIPDDVKWEIEEYDGIEWVSEQHRTWR